MTTSIVIPLRNPGAALLPTLQSLVENTPADQYQVIFVDCGSTDGTAEVLDQLDGDMQVVQAPVDTGFAKCVNIGLLDAIMINMIVVVPVPSMFYPGWLDEMRNGLMTSAIANMATASGDIVGMRTDLLRLHNGLNEYVNEGDVLSEYENRLEKAQQLQQRALSLNVPPHTLGLRVGESLALTFAAALDNPPIGDLPEAAAEHLRERLWAEEERQLLVRARNGRDVCWMDEGVAEPLVTVRIATYNRAEELMEVALPSALNQTYENLDILIVGDHTDDATVKAMKSVRDPRVRFFNLPEQALYPNDRQGHWLVHGSPAMNLGIELAEGSWISPMDDDDAMTLDHVEVLLNEARRQRLEFVWSQTLMEMPDGWQVLGSEPMGSGATTAGAIMWSTGLRFMKMSTTCWKISEPHDQNMWRRMHNIGVKMGFLKRITYRYSPCAVDTRKKDAVAASL